MNSTTLCRSVESCEPNLNYHRRLRALSVYQVVPHDLPDLKFVRDTDCPGLRPIQAESLTECLGVTPQGDFQLIVWW